MPPETDPKKPETEGEKPVEVVTLDQVNSIVNKALSARDARAQAAMEKAIADAFAKQTAAAERKPAEEPAGGAAAKPAETANEKVLREKFEKLEAKYTDAEARAKATEDKARKDATRATLRAALEAKGVKGARARAVVADFEATGALRFAEDGRAELVVKRSRSKGAAAEDLAFDLEAGVEDWTKSPEAGEFLPPPTTPGTRPTPQAASAGVRRAGAPLTYEKPAASEDEMARRAAADLEAKGIDVSTGFR